MNRWAALALLLAVAGALALRLPKLDARPLHNDEGVNAVKLAALWENGDYKYDPHEFHGPTLYYFSLPFLWLNPARNADELDATHLRLVTIAFGVGLILLLPLLADGLGKTAVAVAAVFFAVSPAMVFYSRYFIHEMLLVFFTLLTVAAGWRYARTKKLSWLLLAGAGIGLMFATKETFVLSLAAMIAAAAMTTGWNRWRENVTADAPAHEPAGLKNLFPPTRHLALAILAAGLVWLMLFSSFFTNWRGLPDSVLTYLPWFKRAGGHSPHIHPWYFYLQRLTWWHQAKGPTWSEAMILISALVGMATAICSNRTLHGSVPLARFLAFYTVILAAIYFVIPYKTPWCLLNFWLGIILLAGIGASALLQISRFKLVRVLVLGGLLVGVSDLVAQANRASWKYASDRTNPYNYAQTPEYFLKLIDRVETIAAVAPEKHETVVKLILPESNGPLPWYLRRFKNTGWWEKIPDDPVAPVVIVSAKLNARLDERPGSNLVMTGMYEMHPGSFVELYVDLELWTKVLPHLPRDPE